MQWFHRTKVGKGKGRLTYEMKGERRKDRRMKAVINMGGKWGQLMNNVIHN